MHSRQVFTADWKEPGLWGRNREALSSLDYPGRKNCSALWASFRDVGFEGLVLETFSRPYPLFRLPIRGDDDLAVKHVGDFRPAVHVTRFNFVWSKDRFLQTNLVGGIQHVNSL